MRIMDYLMLVNRDYAIAENIAEGEWLCPVGGSDVCMERQAAYAQIGRAHV